METPTILAIDTSYQHYTTVAVYINDNKKTSISESQNLSQEEKLISTIDRVLTEVDVTLDDINTIAIGLGPGSFTGMRIGISTARAIAWSGNRKIIGFSSIELMARSVPPDIAKNDSLIIPIIDARMKRVFSAVFDKDKRLTDDMDIAPEELKSIIEARSEQNIILVGDGLIKYANIFNNFLSKNITFLPDISISGEVMCNLVLVKKYQLEGLETIQPNYLRKSVAEESLAKK